MAISITKVRVDKIIVDREGKIEGTYCLISEKGDVVAKQEFNGYNTMKFEFDRALSRNLFEEVETEIELEIGIQTILSEVNNVSSEKQGS